MKTENIHTRLTQTRVPFQHQQETRKIKHVKGYYFSSFFREGGGGVVVWACENVSPCYTGSIFVKFTIGY